MALFSLIAKIGLDKTGFDAGLLAARKAVGSFASSIGSHLAAAFGTAAILAYTKYLIEYAHQIEVASKRTGVGTDELQTLGHAAKLTGQDLDNVARALKFLSKSRQEAIDKPGSEAAQVFNALGVTPEALKAGRAELFRAVGRGFQAKDFGASEAAMITKIMGRGSDAMLPMLKNVDELEDKLRAVGGVLKHEQVEQLAKLHDAWVQLTAQVRGPFTGALIRVLNISNSVLKTMTNWSKTAIEYWVGFTRQIVRQPLGLLKEGGMEHFWGNVGRKIAGAHAEGMETIEMMEKKRRADPKPGEVKLFDLNVPADVADMALGRGRFAARPAVDFHFDEKEKSERQKRTKEVRGDLLGRIGGTVGAGESLPRKVDEMVRQLKEMRRTLEVRGVRINGEL